jgi:hypothetical protein
MLRRAASQRMGTVGLSFNRFSAVIGNKAGARSRQSGKRAGFAPSNIFGAMPGRAWAHIYELDVFDQSLKNDGEPGWYRTIDPLIKSQMLYP